MAFRPDPFCSINFAYAEFHLWLLISMDSKHTLRMTGGGS